MLRVQWEASLLKQWLAPKQVYQRRLTSPVTPWDTLWVSSSPAQMSQTLTNVNPLLKSYLKPGGAAIMDKGYDSDAIRESVNQIGGTAVIAVHPKRSQKPDFDEHLSRDRHRIENLFAKLKHFRRIATCYEKLLHSYAAMLALVCIIIWIKH